MERTLKFYKENDKWYLDLPEWEDEKEYLEMVMGADIFLDIISKFTNNVTLCVSLKEKQNYYKINLIKVCEDEGAYYFINNFENIILDMEIWLCNVTKFIFGYFPEYFYIFKM